MEDGLRKIYTPFTQALAWVDSALEDLADAQELSDRDRDYYDGKQLTAEETSILSKRGQPPVVINRIKRKIDYLMGYERKLRADPKAEPRTPDHEEDANAATDALRYACDKGDFPDVASSVWENMLIEGYGGLLLRLREKSGNPDIVYENVPYDRILFDPYSRKADFSDARFLGIVIWLDADIASEMFPDQADNFAAGLAGDWGGTYGDTTDDKPQWIDSDRKRVKIVELHWLERGVWQCGTLTQTGWLVEPYISPFVDDDGETYCPLILQSAYVDRDNNRYGVVRETIGAQDEINKRRSKALHLLSVRQIIAEDGAVKDVDAARKELAKPDGYIVTQPGMKFEIAGTGDMAAGQFSLLQEAKNDIDGMGPNAALIGQNDSASGRALLVNQQSGTTEMEAIFGRFKSWKKRVYRATWWAIRQFWTAEQWVRVTDSQDGLRFVKLNGREIMQDPNTGMIVEMPVGPQVATLDCDIIIEDGPDIATLRGETFGQLIELVKAGVPIDPTELLRNSGIRGAADMVKQMQGDPEQAAQKRAIAEEVQLASATADIEKTQSETAKNMATAEKTALETSNEIAKREIVESVAFALGPPT